VNPLSILTPGIFREIFRRPPPETEPRRMKLDDFDFDLPEGLIATRPARPRSSARLLVAEGDASRDAHVFDLPQILRPGDRLILNDTKVIPARLTGTRARTERQGEVTAKIEVTLLEPQADGSWSRAGQAAAQAGAGRDGGVLRPAVGRGAGAGGRGRLRFNLSGEDFDAALNAAGAMPLPPYIAGKRAADARDREDYQTIWAGARARSPPPPPACISTRRWSPR
jgi:S-adenosylmethionine:tRNA ribosyltransferase-isomerase